MCHSQRVALDFGDTTDLSTKNFEFDILAQDMETLNDDRPNEDNIPVQEPPEGAAPDIDIQEPQEGTAPDIDIDDLLMQIFPNRVTIHGPGRRRRTPTVHLSRRVMTRRRYAATQ